MTTPKQSFQKSQWFKAAESILESEAHQQALFSALLQMQMDSEKTTDTVLSDKFYQRIVGAREFVKILSRLCEPESKSYPEDSSRNINYRV